MEGILVWCALVESLWRSVLQSRDPKALRLLQRIQGVYAKEVGVYVGGWLEIVGRMLDNEGAAIGPALRHYLGRELE